MGCLPSGPSARARTLFDDDGAGGVETCEGRGWRSKRKGENVAHRTAHRSEGHTGVALCTDRHILIENFRLFLSRKTLTGAPRVLKNPPTAGTGSLGGGKARKAVPARAAPVARLRSESILESFHVSTRQATRTLTAHGARWNGPGGAFLKPSSSSKRNTL